MSPLPGPIRQVGYVVVDFDGVSTLYCPRQLRGTITKINEKR